MIEEAQQISKEVYLNILCETHYETSILVSELHKFDEQYISPFSGAPVLTTILDRSFEDLYVPYLDEERYIQIETEWLLQQFQLYLGPFFISNVS